MYLFISCLYVFRESQRSSSGDRIVLIHHLVCRSGIPSSYLRRLIIPDHTKNTNVMHLILFIRQIFSSTCFEYQVLIFRRIQLYVSSIWHRHSVKGEWSNITKT